MTVSDATNPDTEAIQAHCRGMVHVIKRAVANGDCTHNQALGLLRQSWRDATNDACRAIIAEAGDYVKREGYFAAARAVGCPVLGHDCYERRCTHQCRMSAFGHDERR